MIMIALAYDDECKKELEAKGFREEKLMVRHEPIQSTEENKAKLEHEFFAMRRKTFQFLVSDYWGMASAD